MPRLPQPGGDSGNWGSILNDFLLTEHNTDGTHKLPNGSVPYAVLSTSVQSSLSLADNALQPTLYTAKGALLSASAAGTPTILGVGSNGQVLVADSSAPSGLSWSSIAVGVSDGDKGDITVSGGGASWNIDAGVITDTEVAAGAAIDQAKIANLTADLAAKVDRIGQQFSKGLVIADPVTGVLPVWRAQFACRVVAIHAYRSGGLSATINVVRNGTDDHLAADLSVGAQDAWVTSTTIQNDQYAVGEALSVDITGLGGVVAVIAIQVDLETL